MKHSVSKVQKITVRVLYFEGNGQYVKAIHEGEIKTFPYKGAEKLTSTGMKLFLMDNFAFTTKEEIENYKSTGTFPKQEWKAFDKEDFKLG